ncbi:hypothetical protein EXM22_09315 [Oceanispirochaeta crateris]|uniref:Alginate export domain-containing protein n=1 Tax=Oceanispirochaeta crateris TaxID=2518645 RepID=A0A5C1QJ41_9SPIO|nr:hypothetical protein [Oceanispirochaeta crateris]QEN08175.1 hypothetical protein EXM22_09315 [Oceanispirochaeta crateris]
MNKLRNLITMMLFVCGVSLFGEIPDLELGGMKLEFEGEVRSRLAYFNNYDMDYETSDAKIAADMRAQFAIDILTQSPFYFSILTELGNIQFDNELEGSDFYLIELKEFYGGYNGDDVEGKAGIIDVKTPDSSVYEDDNLGVQAKIDFDFLQAKSFITMPNLLSDSWEVVDGISNLSYLAFLGASQEYFVVTDLWTMFLWDNGPEDFYYYCFWTGLELEKKYRRFSGNYGFIYNFGAATYLKIPISAYYSHLKLELETTKKTKLYSRFNLSSGTDGSSDTINQFQVVNGEGNLETGLGLLFGGSSFSNQSYFSNESLSIVEDGLSSGDFAFSDPGLFIYELGFEIDVNQLLDTTEFVLGGANTGELFDGEGYFTSLIGWEMDIHNTVKFTDDLKLNLSFSYLIAGNSFNAVYELNTGDSLTLDTSFKTDCSIKYSY